MSIEKIYRARNPVTPSRLTVRGQFPSYKVGRMIAWESQLERRACYLFEFSNDIQTFREQPVRLHIPYQNTIKRYTPDFEVISHTGEIAYYEIKPRKRLIKLQNYFHHIHIFLQQRGIGFFVLTEQELIHPIREKNFVFLRQYQNITLNNQQYNDIKKIYDIYNTKQLPFSMLENVFNCRSILYALLAHNYLSYDFNMLLNANTIITLNTKRYK